MKTALFILVLAAVVGVISLAWINKEINEAARNNHPRACDTDAFNYKGVRPDWCKE